MKTLVKGVLRVVVVFLIVVNNVRLLLLDWRIDRSERRVARMRDRAERLDQRGCGLEIWLQQTD